MQLRIWTVAALCEKGYVNADATKVEFYPDKPNDYGLFSEGPAIMSLPECFDKVDTAQLA